MSKAFQASGTNQDIEVTLEANPSDVSQDKLKGFLQAGINRLSMGFQVTQSKSKTPITRSIHYKFNCITVALDRTRHSFYIIQNVH